MIRLELSENKKTPVQKPRIFRDPNKSSGLAAAGLFFYKVTKSCQM